jgi:hypothetical protein
VRQHSLLLQCLISGLSHKPLLYILAVFLLLFQPTIHRQGLIFNVLHSDVPSFSYKSSSSFINRTVSRNVRSISFMSQFPSFLVDRFFVYFIIFKTYRDKFGHKLDTYAVSFLPVFINLFFHNDIKNCCLYSVYRPHRYEYRRYVQDWLSNLSPLVLYLPPSCLFAYLLTFLTL